MNAAALTLFVQAEGPLHDMIDRFVAFFVAASPDLKHAHPYVYHSAVWLQTQFAACLLPSPGQAGMDAIAG